MKRVCIALCALALVASFVSVASADHSLGGYYRMQFLNPQTYPVYYTLSDDRSLHSAEDEIDLGEPLPTGHRVYGSYTLQGITTDLDEDGSLMNRLAAGYRYGFSNSWSLTYAGELDNTRRNQYLRQGSDRYKFYDDLDYETTRAHLDYRSQNGFHLRAGVQGVWDNLDGMVLVDNALGLKAVARLGVIDATIFYFNLYQEDKRRDDGDLYGLQLQYGLQGAVGVSAGLDFYDYSDKWSDVNFLGLHTDYNFGSTTVGGAFVYGFGDVTTPQPLESEYAAYAATIKATTLAGPVELGCRLFYFSGDDDPDDNEVNTYNAIHRFVFPNDGSLIFLWNAHSLAQKDTSLAFSSRGTKGASLSAAWAGDHTYLSTYLGYFSAVEEPTDEFATNKAKHMGTEVAMRMGYEFDSGLDLSLSGAKAFLGDYFDASPGGEDLDDLYIVYATVKMPFSFDF
jgi:hypothetical protein